MLRCPYKSRPEENKDKVHLHYSNTVDSWAVGVLTYELLVGCPPFADRTKVGTEHRIKSTSPAYPTMMTESAKDFVVCGECAGTHVGLAGGSRGGVCS